MYEMDMYNVYDMICDIKLMLLQGYKVSSQWDSDEFDDLLALSCNACAEQVRKNNT